MERLEAVLVRNHLSVFRFERSISLGDSIPREIERGLSSAHLFFIIISRASLESGWVRLEYDTAIDRLARGRLRLIPILIGDVDPPPFVEHIRWLRVRIPTDLDGLPALMFRAVQVDEIPPGHLSGFRRLVTHGKEWRGIDLNSYRVIVSRNSEQDLGGVLIITRGTDPFEIVYEEEVFNTAETWGSLSLIDIDDDGHPEVSYLQSSFGTGGGAIKAMLVRCRDGLVGIATHRLQTNNPFEHESWLEFSGPLGHIAPYHSHLRLRHQRSTTTAESGHEIMMRMKAQWRFDNWPFRRGSLKVAAARGRVFLDRSHRAMGDDAPAGFEFDTEAGQVRYLIASRLFDLHAGQGIRIVSFYKDGVYQEERGEVFPIYIPEFKYDWCESWREGDDRTLVLTFRDGLEIEYRPADRWVVKVIEDKPMPT